MRRTRASTVIALIAVGAGLGILLQLTLAAASQPKLRPEYSLAITLALLGVIVVALAAPVRRAARGSGRTRVDPFYATRVVLLAKASALAGAILTGAGAGLLLELLLRSTAPADDSSVRTLVAFGGAVALLVGGLIGEWFCTVPPSDRDDDEPPGLDTGRLER